MFVQTNRTEMSITRITTYYLGTIDGLPLGKAARFPNGEKGYPVTAGNHTLGLAVAHGSPPHQQGRLNADGFVHMKLKTGMIYQVAGSVPTAHRVDFWIEEKDTKKRVSEVVTVIPKNLKMAPPTIIFLPAS